MESAKKNEIIFLSIQDFVVPLSPSMARQMPNLLYFRGLTIRFVSIRLEVQFRIAPTKAKFKTTNVQYETVRHDMAYPHLLYFVVGPSVVGAALNWNSTR